MNHWRSTKPPSCFSVSSYPSKPNLSIIAFIASFCIRFWSLESIRPSFCFLVELADLLLNWSAHPVACWLADWFINGLSNWSMNFAGPRQHVWMLYCCCATCKADLGACFLTVRQHEANEVKDFHVCLHSADEGWWVLTDLADLLNVYFKHTQAHTHTLKVKIVRTCPVYHKYRSLTSKNNSLKPC